MAESVEKSPLFLGIDVGGTNIKLGLVSGSGDVVEQLKFPTEANDDPQQSVASTRKHFEALLGQSGIGRKRVVAAGLGTPGPMDIPSGMILEPPNLPGWRHFPIVAAFEAALSLPVTFANDANAAAYGEFWIGAAREYSSLALLTLGTGIGGGLIIDGFLVAGAHSLGGEVGHITVDTSAGARRCACGQAGHLEAYSSATALVERTAERLSGTDVRSALTEAQPLTALAISQAAEAGDALALEMIWETADYLARGIALVAHVVDPQAVLLGGAMNFGGAASELGKAFLSRVSEQSRKLVFPSIASKMIIEFASLGSDAGWIGAAGLARNAHQGVG